MSEIFEGYERRFREVSTSLGRKCLSVATLDGVQKQLQLSELKNALDEGESLIRRMDLEARSLPPTEKATLLAKLRGYKSDLNNLKRDTKKSSTTQTPLVSREELLEAGLGDSISTSVDERNQMLMTTERLNQSGERLKESKRVLLETEDLGVSILQDLHQQRQTLLHARDTLHGVDDNIGKSRRILNSMSKRISRNKWIMGGIIGALMLVILLIIYFKWKSPK